MNSVGFAKQNIAQWQSGRKTQYRREPDEMWLKFANQLKGGSIKKIEEDCKTSAVYQADKMLHHKKERIRYD